MYTTDAEMAAWDARIKNMTYRFVWPNSDPAVLPTTQHDALVAVANRWQMTGTVTVQPLFGGDGAVIVNVGSMFLVVEPDGYTHS